MKYLYSFVTLLLCHSCLLDQWDPPEYLYLHTNGNGGFIYDYYIPRIINESHFLPNELECDHYPVHIKVLAHKGYSVDSVVVDGKNVGKQLYIQINGPGTKEITAYFSPYVTPKMKLIRAKGSTFIFGDTINSNLHEDQCVIPYSEQTLQIDYLIDSTEVTQQEFDEVMFTTYENYSQPDWWSPQNRDSNFPAFNVSWYDAILYCNARSKLAGLDTVYSYDTIKDTIGHNCTIIGLDADLDINGFRLPTELEWEFACRAGVTSDYFWGEDYRPELEYSELPKIEGYVSWQKRSTVASKKPNNLSLYDMSGNLYEWCHDWFASTIKTDIKPETGKVIRGGSSSSSKYTLTSASRDSRSPTTTRDNLGFRVVRKF